MTPSRKDVTRLIESGQREELLEVVYDELKQLANHHMARERDNHTLQATALVHEAYLRLLDTPDESWEKRRHFYASASEAMRRILIEHARRVQTERRGGGARRVTLSTRDQPVELDAEQAINLSDALDTLAREDERAAAVARLRFLSGLDVQDTAKALDISVRTVHREWAFAKARLAQLLGL